MNYCRCTLLRLFCNQCFAWGFQCPGQQPPWHSKTSSFRMTIWKVTHLPAAPDLSSLTQRQTEREMETQSWVGVVDSAWKSLDLLSFFLYRLFPLFYPTYLVLLIFPIHSFNHYNNPHNKKLYGNRRIFISWRKLNVSKGQRLKYQERQHSYLYVSYLTL